MKAQDIKAIFHKELDHTYGSNEVESFFFLSSKHHFNIARIQIALEPELTFTTSETDTFFQILEDLKQQKPIQYILGETEFYGLKFKVNSDVLIPRPETEELVDWIITEVRKHQKTDVANDQSEKLRILDLGTGSGCISISLAKNLPGAKVFAVDISEKALDVAKENANNNDVEVEFVKGDVLNESFQSSTFENGKFDIIVSNPPYVRRSEKEQMKPNVLENEPDLALFVEDNDPLLFYKAITKFAVNNLKANGQLFFEINQYLGTESKTLLEDANFQNIELRKDINGNYRMLKGQKK